MTSCTNEENLLRNNRPLILAMEMIGWLHMAGKADVNFLNNPDGFKFKEWYKNLSLLDEFKKEIEPLYKGIQSPKLEKFFEEFQGKTDSLLGLLQAGHGIASGIEKNIPKDASKYLGQEAINMWLSTAFGYLTINLLVNEPTVLTHTNWTNLKNIESIIQRFIGIIQNTTSSLDDYYQWRKNAINTLHHGFTMTLAETRLPNNDVTLWDQSYVAASLFKSALAGIVLEGKFELNKAGEKKLNKPIQWKDIKEKTEWRLLTVGFGSDYYASRAVRIGDWSGTWLDIQEFFEEVRKLIEVDLALGNLLYKDTQLCVFSFPAEQQSSSTFVSNLKPCLEKKIATIAKSKNLETPPYCNILDLSSRSLIKIIKEIKGARDKLVIPIHQNWEICEKLESRGHICPVCQVRLNGNNSKKDKPCEVCKNRRTHRLDSWLAGKFDTDTIWIPELADDNDRVALLTFNFNLEPWLEGSKVDSLRAQAIREWVIDQKSKNQNNPIDENKSFESLLNYIKGKLSQFDKTDIVLKNLHDGYQYETTWKTFFQKIVEDRSDSTDCEWDNLDDTKRAHWLTHQLLRKHPSPGRVHRFWRTTETFFDELLQRFRETAAQHENRWRVKRLIIKDASSSSKPDSNTYYESRVDDKSINLLYRKNTGDFITIFNLARILKDNDDPSAKLKELTLKDDEGKELKIAVSSINDRNSGSLGIYHPVIPIEQSPERFRILVPLSAATACVNQAIEKWQTEFARVWDRMPLQVGIVAFPQKSPIQGIIEAARNMEDALAEKTETWRVETKKTCGDCVALSLEREQDKRLELQTVPVRLPDGRADVFYPYCTVEDSEVRFSLDFKHPKGTVYRHVEELRIGEGITVSPARFAMTFMDSSAERFEPIKTHYLADWSKMQAIWQLLTEVAPSQTALQGVWQALAEQRQKWQNPDGAWTTNEEKQIWLNFARSLLAEQLGVKGQILATLVEAVDSGIFEMSLFWYFRVLKEGIEK